MDKKRATEISNLRNMVDVTYHGNPVYIENVNPTKDCASIHYLDKPELSKEVSLSELDEMK